MDFEVTDDGIFRRDHDTRTKICDQPVEFVSYSRLDQTHYLRWPAETYHHMATLPDRLLDAPESAIAAWAHHHEIPLHDDHIGAFGAFLRQQAVAQV